MTSRPTSTPGVTHDGRQALMAAFYPMTFAIFFAGDGRFLEYVEGQRSLARRLGARHLEPSLLVALARREGSYRSTYAAKRLYFRRVDRMSGRGPRNFRYGARLAVTAPLAAVFIAVGAEMVMLALAARLYWRVVFVILAALAILLALSMVREALVRLRGKRQIVVAARELIIPADRGTAGVTIPYRDIRKLELSADQGFKRVLEIGHTNGEVKIAGVMLGSVGELDEIHGLIKAARKTR